MNDPRVNQLYNNEQRRQISPGQASLLSSLQQASVREVSPEATIERLARVEKKLDKVLELLTNSKGVLK